MPTQEYSYVISVDDFDKSLLPPDARTPGTEAFRSAVNEAIAKDFADSGGQVRIVVDAKQIEVRWHSSPVALDPMQAALQKIQHGEHEEGVRMLENLRRLQPDNLDVVVNLGMVLSDIGKPEAAETYLRHALELAPGNVEALVALGVALSRLARHEDAITILRQAVTADPNNLWAHRNLGACLLVMGQVAPAEVHLRKAVELGPQDPQAIFGLAQVLQATGKPIDADALFAKVIELDPRSSVAELAREARGALAHESFRATTPTTVRSDAVMYCLDALQQYAKMTKAEVKKCCLEITLLGQQGLDPHDSAQNHTLRSLPGKFSGLHLLCLMYVGFQQIDPDYDIRFDLSAEYKLAQNMFKQRQGEGG